MKTDDADQVRMLDARVRLGAAVRARAERVAAQVLANWRCQGGADGDVTAGMVETITRTSSLATELVGRWLMDGARATLAEQDELAHSGRESAAGGFSPMQLIGNYLAWRDFACAAVAAAAVEVSADDGAVDDAITMVRRSFDVSVMQMMAEFEKQRDELQAALAAERAALTHLALHDPLTGLANRAMLMERLGHALTGLPRSGRRCAVLFIDLDNFKQVNDSAGHHVGDKVLVAVGERLRGLVRAHDTVARLGGDEFVVLMEEPGRLGSAQEAAERIIELLREPFEAAGMVVRSSVGIALADGTSSSDQILTAADTSMYADKQRRRTERSPDPEAELSCATEHRSAETGAGRRRL